MGYIDHNIGLDVLNCHLSLEKYKTKEINERKQQGEALENILDSINVLTDVLNTIPSQKEQDFREDEKIRNLLNQLFKHNPHIISSFHWNLATNKSEYTNEICEDIANTLKKGEDPSYGNLYCLQTNNFERFKERLEQEKHPLLKAINQGTSEMNNEHGMLLASTQVMRKTLEKHSNLLEHISRKG